MTNRNKKISNDIIKIPEIKVSYQRDRIINYPGTINSSEIAADLIRSLFDKDEIELHEVMFVIYLNRGNYPIGYYKHSIGGLSSTILDTQIVLGAALRSLSSAIIISHNHPSGNVKPSEGDIKVTKNIKAASKVFNIQVLDHIVLTKNGYTSLSDEGLMGLDKPYPIKVSTSPTVQEDNASTKQLELEAMALKIELELLKNNKS